MLHHSSAASSSYEIIAKNCHEEQNCFISQPKGMEMETWNNRLLISTGRYHYFEPHLFWDVLSKITWSFVGFICYQMNTWSFSSLKFMLIMYLTIAKLVIWTQCVSIPVWQGLPSFLPDKILLFNLLYLFLLILLCIHHGFNIKYKSFRGGGE